jgi:hypothetical protein
MSQGTLDLSAGSERILPLPESVTERRALAVVHALLVVAGAVVLWSYGLIAAAHARDRYQVNFVSAVYAELAAETNAGRFYPEVYDGSHYAGTRYTPGHFVLHAGLARLTGEYLLSGKLIAYAATLALLVQLFVILRRLGCRRSVAFALLGLVVTSTPGYLAATTIRGDLLPVALQLGALLLAAGAPTPRRAAFAGACCTLAILTKLSAVWAPVAITVWYLLRDRRCCLVFAASWLGTLVAALGVLHLATSGRMLENFRAVSSSEVGLRGVLLAPPLFLWRVGRAGVLMTVLLPLVVVEGVLAYRQRRVTVFHYAFVACLPVLLVIYSDMGADTNHLLDFVVLAVPLIGGLFAAVYGSAGRGAGYCIAASAALGWLLYVSWANSMIFPVMDVWRNVDRGYSAKPLAETVADGEPIVSEDPWIALSRGQRPTVLDPFALARLGHTRPDAVQALVGRIERQEFTHVVTLQRLDESNPHDRYDWSVRHFGPAVVAALRANYTLEKHAEGYYVYRRTTAAQARLRDREAAP